MTPEQKARVITQLMENRKDALAMVSFHEQEALRYRRHFVNLGQQIIKVHEDPETGGVMEYLITAPTAFFDAMEHVFKNGAKFSEHNSDMLKKVVIGKALDKVKRKMLTKKKNSARIKKQ